MDIKKTSGKIKLKMNYSEYSAFCIWVDSLCNVDFLVDLKHQSDYMNQMVFLTMKALYSKLIAKENCPLASHHVRQDKNSISLDMRDAVIMHWALRHTAGGNHMHMNLYFGIDRLLK